MDWMDEVTRENALIKLQMIETKLGYPDRWKEIPPGTLISKSYFNNVLNLNRFWKAKSLKEVGKAIDRQKWRVTAPTVNAYYDASYNQINSPAIYRVNATLSNLPEFANAFSCKKTVR